MKKENALASYLIKLGEEVFHLHDFSNPAGEDEETQLPPRGKRVFGAQ